MNKPMICGGFLEDKSGDESKSKKCFEAGNATNNVNMSVPRVGAASIPVGNKLWVTGGRDETASTTLKSTEYMAWGMATEAGPDLPESMRGHCLGNF